MKWVYKKVVKWAFYSVNYNTYFSDFPFFAGIFVVLFSLVPFSAYCTVKNLFEPESYKEERYLYIYLFQEWRSKPKLNNVSLWTQGLHVDLTNTTHPSNLVWTVAVLIKRAVYDINVDRCLIDFLIWRLLDRSIDLLKSNFTVGKINSDCVLFSFVYYF